MSECGAGWVEVVHRGPSVSGEGRRDPRWAKHTAMIISSFFLAFPHSSTLPSQPYTLFRPLLCCDTLVSWTDLFPAPVVADHAWGWISPLPGKPLMTPCLLFRQPSVAMRSSY